MQAATGRQVCQRGAALHCPAMQLHTVVKAVPTSSSGHCQAMVLPTRPEGKGFIRRQGAIHPWSSSSSAVRPPAVLCRVQSAECTRVMEWQLLDSAQSRGSESSPVRPHYRVPHADALGSAKAERERGKTTGDDRWLLITASTPVRAVNRLSLLRGLRGSAARCLLYCTDGRIGPAAKCSVGVRNSKDNLLTARPKPLPRLR